MVALSTGGMAMLVMIRGLCLWLEESPEVNGSMAVHF
jgi:hypothetical protein